MSTVWLSLFCVTSFAVIRIISRLLMSMKNPRCCTMQSHPMRKVWSLLMKVIPLGETPCSPTRHLFSPWGSWPGNFFSWRMAENIKCGLSICELYNFNWSILLLVWRFFVMHLQHQFGSLTNFHFVQGLYRSRLRSFWSIFDFVCCLGGPNKSICNTNKTQHDRAASAEAI